MLMGAPKPESHTHLCQPARLKHGRHSYEVAARIDEVRQRLIVEEGKVGILASQRSSQGSELRLHMRQAQGSSNQHDVPHLPVQRPESPA